MHLVFHLSGVPQQATFWKAMAQNQFFKWRRINLKTNKEEIILIQAGLRDSVLGTLEFTFPKEALPTVLCIMDLKEGMLGVQPSFKSKARVAVLRRILGLKKIPKKAFKEAEELNSSIMFDDLERGLSDLQAARVSIHPIGIKADKRGTVIMPSGVKYEQEMI